MSTYGAIEAGGTRWVCATVDERGEVLARRVLVTTTPAETIAEAIEFFRGQAPVPAIGIGCFGPLDLRPGSPTRGYITTTPKPGWAFTDVVTPFEQAFGVPVALATDVNAAALGELLWGRAVGLRNFVYLTVGTGIGGGAFVDGRPLGGDHHPEVGHMRIPHDRAVDPFAGSCPYHGDCLEGLASGVALRQRWGRPAEELEADDVWELEATYLAYGLANLTHTLAPERIVVGGGVARRPLLLGLTRARLIDLLAGYVDLPGLADGLEDYVTPPGLDDLSGVLGAAELARRATADTPVAGFDAP